MNRSLAVFGIATTLLAQPQKPLLGTAILRFSPAARGACTTTRARAERPVVISLSETAISRPMPAAMRETRSTRNGSGKTTVKISA